MRAFVTSLVFLFALAGFVQTACQVPARTPGEYASCRTDWDCRDGQYCGFSAFAGDPRSVCRDLPLDPRNPGELPSKGTGDPKGRPSPAGTR